MTIHFRLDIHELRPLGRTARGVKSMNLKEGDKLVSMDVLSCELVDQLANLDEEDIENENENEEDLESKSSNGPWVLIASAFGLGKRVPVTKFRLQKRAGMGLSCLLYTSPSPRDRTRSRMPSSA